MDEAHGENTEPAGGRLVDVVLDEASIARSTPDVEHERAVAVYDLLEENVFSPVGVVEGPYRLVLSIRENRLVFTIQDEGEGFDHEAYQARPPEGEGYRGRGITLARTLSFSSVTYMGSGSVVEAVILLDGDDA